MTMQYLYLLCIFASLSPWKPTDGTCIIANEECYNSGTYVDGECICPYGWSGTHCENCVGRFIVNETSGVIGMSDKCFLHSSNCLWVIKPPQEIQSPLLKLTYIETKGACDGQEFIVFDGEGNNQPILANFNGIVEALSNTTSETSSGYAMIQFKHQESTSTFKLHYQFVEANATSTANEAASEECIGRWCFYKWSHMSEQGRASAAISHNNDLLYVYGGVLFGHQQTNYNFYTIDLNSKEAHSLDELTNPPPMRFGHTISNYQNDLLVFGGITFSDYEISNQLWVYNSTSLQWSQLDTMDAPQLTGHTAHVVTRDMKHYLLVFFGYIPTMEYSNNIFQLDLTNNTWTILETTGAIPIGHFGHASVHDPVTNVIYLNGGYHGDNVQDVNTLYEFATNTNYWRVLTVLDSESRFMHSLNLLSNALYIVGGRTKQEACQDLPEVIYSIEYNLEFYGPEKIDSFPQMYGHSSVSTNASHLVVYGGFDSTMTSDVMTTGFMWEMLNTTSQDIQDYINNQIPDCLAFNESLCSDFNTFCWWSNGTCTNRTCPTFYGDLCTLTCKALSSCFDCLSLSSNCCNCQYHHERCYYDNNDQLPGNMSVCGDPNEAKCSLSSSCGLCATFEGCAWVENKCIYSNETFTCEDSCSNRTTCYNCTFDNQCYWCDTTHTCLEMNAVNVFYPYDTCTNFIHEADQCEVDECSTYNNCDDCHSNVDCGWCNFNDTGAGLCSSGSIEGPYNASLCEHHQQWNFVSCEGCQCNGHSDTCIGSPYNCTLCDDDTYGGQCETCVPGYYGHPTNDGQCDECECNGHADSCLSSDDSFGQCNCDVQGMTGKYCDDCVSPRYSGSPTSVNGSCFYSIQLQIRYIFSLTENDYKDKINFDICPRRAKNLRLTLQIDQNRDPNGTFDAIVTTNLTNVSNSETIFHQYRNENYVVLIFKNDEFHFNEHPLRCIRIYMQYDPPLYFSISFEIAMQQNYMNIPILIGTFFVCFFSLMLAAGIIYKVQEVLARRRLRVRRQIEMRVMAARPFTSVDFDVEHSVSPLEKESTNAALCKESCEDNHVVVLTALLWMPKNSEGSHQLTFGSSLICVRPTTTSTLPKHDDDDGDCSTLQRFTTYFRNIVHSKNREDNTTSGFDNPVLDLHMDTVVDTPPISNNSISNPNLIDV